MQDESPKTVRGVQPSVRRVVAALASVALGLSGCSSGDTNDDGASPMGGAGTGNAGAAVAGTAASTGGTAAPTAGAAAAAGGTTAGTGAGVGGAAAGAMGGVGGAAAGTMGGAGGATAATGGVAAGTGGAMGGMTAGTGGVAAAGTGGAMGGDAGPMAGTMAQPPAGTCLQGAGAFDQDGPYDVETTTVTIGSSGQFTIFIPTPLEDDCPHPMVAWGNGTTVSGGTAYSHFNNRMASWGIIAVASHDPGTGSGAVIGDGSFHRAAIDYMLAENEDPNSQFYGKFSGRAGVSGHSQGGGGGNVASTHPNVEANGNVQGAGARSGTPPPDDVPFLCLTGTEDIATEGCLTAVDGVTSAPSMYASYDGMSHTATLSASSAGSQEYARMLTAWFRCFLADDTDACAMFMGGDSCPICQEAGWDNIYINNY